MLFVLDKDCRRKGLVGFKLAGLTIFDMVRVKAWLSRRDQVVAALL